MNWLSKHAQALQALGALMTVLIAIAALIGVKWQIDSAARIAQAQTAREFYRDYVALSLAQPKFANPAACPEFSNDETTSYEYYVEYLLYTAEQVIEADPDWAGTFESEFESHLSYICTITDGAGYTPAVAALIAGIRQDACRSRPDCAQ